MEFQVVVEWENDGEGFSAFLPDLPGCVATGKTVAEVLSDMSSALEVHLEGMCEDGDEIPENFRFEAENAGTERAA